MSSVLRELKRYVRRFEPCLPRPAKQPPAGKGWIHEIKHDGFRVVAWRDGNEVRLLSRKGYDLTDRFQYAAAATVATRGRTDGLATGRHADAAVAGQFVGVRGDNCDGAGSGLEGPVGRSGQFDRGGKPSN